MLNKANEEIVERLVNLIIDWEASGFHDGLVYDVWERLNSVRKGIGDYMCPECKRPADGVSKGCHTCAQRHPRMYHSVYGGHW